MDKERKPQTADDMAERMYFQADNYCAEGSRLITEAADMIKAQDAIIAEMRKALVPFAACADLLDDDEWARLRLPASDYRRARAAHDKLKGYNMTEGNASPEKVMNLVDKIQTASKRLDEARQAWKSARNEAENARIEVGRAEAQLDSLVREMYQEIGVLADDKPE